MGDNMDEGCGCATVIIALFSPFFFFFGEPDLMDGIIAWLMK